MEKSNSEITSKKIKYEIGTIYFDTLHGSRRISGKS